MPAQDVVPEVLPPDYSRPMQSAIHFGPVSFSRATTVESPFFWMLLGAGIMGAVCWYASRRHN